MSVAEIPLWAALPAALLLVCGGLLTLVGSLGLLRLDSFYARIHAPTMGSTLGAGCVLVASMLTSSALAERPVIHELLITVFILLTSPVTAMLLMRAAVFRSRG
ncbi:MAG: cation:proton antiporter [Burkholderiales bacterium]|nr:cation:proton antiporter [Burkholderiales bacterium]